LFYQSNVGLVYYLWVIVAVHGGEVYNYIAALNEGVQFGFILKVGIFEGNSLEFVGLKA
jgi:hypothetical protein